ncbi:LysE family translocator [uncultured Roseibium sp.]|uniref:LysE family translocator n=1 Tax=uncultured Roseibium sp. TaxID=1936171 RepID=UPI002636DE3D|nr:LysE family translocator [uncultured Roseibium sp.]
MDIADLTTILAAFLVVTISPGPANIAVATVAMRSGRKLGLQFGFGLGVGLAFWGMVAASGLGAVLQASETVLYIFKFFGGCYLLWLAFQSARAAAASVKPVTENVSRGKWFVRGLVLNLSNPKAVVAWMAALSVGLDIEAPIEQLAAPLVLCAMIGFLNYFGHALAFSHPGFMTAYLRLRRWIDSVVAGLFATAGSSLVASVFNR